MSYEIWLWYEPEVLDVKEEWKLYDTQEAELVPRDRSSSVMEFGSTDKKNQFFMLRAVQSWMGLSGWGMSYMFRDCISTPQRCHRLAPACRNTVWTASVILNCLVAKSQPESGWFGSDLTQTTSACLPLSLYVSLSFTAVFVSSSPSPHGGCLYLQMQILLIQQSCGKEVIFPKSWELSPGLSLPHVTTPEPLLGQERNMLRTIPGSHVQSWSWWMVGSGLLYQNPPSPCTRKGLGCHSLTTKQLKCSDQRLGAWRLARKDNGCLLFFPLSSTRGTQKSHNVKLLTYMELWNRWVNFAYWLFRTLMSFQSIY